jgi:starch-binding outer membrane protein, SusD/RagB family
MKKYIIIFLVIGLGSFSLPSCQDYLDKAPAAGVNQDQIFTKYVNFQLYFNSVYEGVSGSVPYNMKCGGYNMYWALATSQFTWDELTDLSILGIDEQGSIRGGMMGGFISRWYSYHVSVLMGNWSVIRTCNRTLQNIGMLQDAVQEDIDDMIAQAHFVRAFAHYTLCKWWGGMPYVTKVLGPEDELDIPRLSNHENYMRCVADLDTAITYYEKAGRMRRDPGPGQVGHLTHPDMKKPNGVAAKALKGRLLLYAASPQNNELGQADWEAAAKANWEALQSALSYNYDLQTAANYKLNYVGAQYTNEKLLGYYFGTYGYNSYNLRAYLPGPIASLPSTTYGECPTQNFIDRFETKWGDPLVTQADRDAATAAGHYNEQDPYANRDPRLKIDIIYNQTPIPGFGTANIYFENVGGTIVWGDLVSRSFQGITITGYYNRKIWGEQSVKNQISPQYSDPVIRLGELYLNYAEAANEVYGPTTIPPYATMSALDAVNKIRSRWSASELAPVQAKFTTSKDAFRPRIKNERNIELCFEGHYYFDIRRWKDAPALYSAGTNGVTIEKLPVSTTYPTGFKYTRYRIPESSQTRWFDYMYYLPFTGNDNFQTKNFVPNVIW